MERGWMFARGRDVRRWFLLGLLVGLVGVAGAGAEPSPAAPRHLVKVEPSWRLVRQVSRVLADQRYVFMLAPPTSSDPYPTYGRLLDEQTGKSRHVAPPVGDCAPVLIGGGWLAYLCRLSSSTRYLELYRIPTGRWRSLAQPSDARGAWAVGAMWVQFYTTWSPTSFVFKNITTGQVRTLAEWVPGGSTIPDLNSPALARHLCQPLRVPAEWNPIDQTYGLGSLSFFGQFALVQGSSSPSQGFEYLERCSSHHKATPRELSGGFLVGNRNAIAIGADSNSNPTGVFLPSLDGFAIEVKNITSPYNAPYSEPDSYQLFFTARRMYLEAGIPPPDRCGNHPVEPCPPSPIDLWSAPAPKEPHKRSARLTH